MKIKRKGRTSVTAYRLRVVEGVDLLEHMGMQETVFRSMIRKLRRRGWGMKASLPYRHMRGSSPMWVGSKGVLECELEYYSGTIILGVYPAGAGRHCKQGEMPYLTRIKTELELRSLKKWLEERCGYEPGPYAAVVERYYTLKKLLKELESKPRERIPAREALSAEGGRIKPGSAVWVRGHDGRARRGLAFYDNNGMWRVVFGEVDMSVHLSTDVMLSCPKSPRRQVSPKIRRTRLEEQISAAIANDDFDRAKLLRRILFGDQPLYRIKMSRDGSYYAPCSQGYRHRADAGRYTAEEARGIAIDRGKDVAIEPIGKAPPLVVAEREST